MLPVEAGGLQEPLAVEIGAYAHLDALDVRHQDEADRVLPRKPGARLQHGAHVRPVAQAADVIVRRAETRAVELQHVAAGLRVEEGDRVGDRAEVPGRRGGEPDARHDLLRVGAVVLQPVAEAAPADHLEALGAQVVGDAAAAVGHVLKDDEAVGARFPHPGEGGLPIVHALDHARHRAVALRLGDRDARLVPLPLQPEVEGGEVAIVADAEKAHHPLRTRRPL